MRGAVRAWIADYLERSLATLDARAFVLGMRGLASVARTRRDPGRVGVRARRAQRRTAVWRALPWRLISLWESPTDDITAYREAILAGTASGQHALACMLGYRAIGAPVADAVVGYLSSAASALAAVAARAVPLGQRDVGAHAVVAARADRGLRARRVRGDTLDDLTSSALACEIDAMRHAALDARLFAS